MKLARTPRELLRSISIDEIVELMAFERLEPFGALAEQFMAGQVAATIANVNRDPRTNDTPYSALDFMPALRGAEEQVVEVAPLRGEELDADQLSALLDATMFGKTMH